MCPYLMYDLSSEIQSADIKKKLEKWEKVEDLFKDTASSTVLTNRCKILGFHSEGDVL